MDDKKLEITSQSMARCEIVTIKGADGAETARIDTFTSPQLDDYLQAVESVNIVIDMQYVDFLSSKGLWVLNETQKRLTAAGGKLVLANVIERIRESFTLVGMADYFSIFVHEEDGVSYPDKALTAAVGSI